MIESWDILINISLCKHEVSAESWVTMSISFCWLSWVRHKFQWNEFHFLEHTDLITLHMLERPGAHLRHSGYAIASSTSPVQPAQSLKETE